MDRKDDTVAQKRKKLSKKFWERATSNESWRSDEWEDEESRRNEYVEPRVARSRSRDYDDVTQPYRRMKREREPDSRWIPLVI